MPRRGNHEATITKRADGRWEARLSLPNGKRKSFYGKTRSEAAKRLTQAQHDLSKGLPIVPEKLTVGQYLETWLAAMVMQVDASTWRRYSNQISHVPPHIGRLALAKLSAQHLTSWYADLVKEVLSRGTVHHLHGVIHHALDDAVDMHLLLRNEADHAKAPRAEETEIQPLSEYQSNTFLAYLAEQQHRFEALYVLALTTGMREGELLALHWSEITLERRLLEVKYTLQEKASPGEKNYVLAKPKTRKSRRSIQLGELAREALIKQKTRQNAEKLSVGLDEWQEQGLVFPNYCGKIYKPSALYMQFQKLLKQADLPRIRFHDLRHTCATILLARGIPVKQVSEMLGHSDIAITLRVYGHVLPTMHEQAASMMDMVFGHQLWSPTVVSSARKGDPPAPDQE